MGLIRDVQARPSVQDLVETFGADRVYPTLRDSIGVWGAIRRQDCLNTFGRKYSFKGAAELGISIMDQKSRVIRLFLELPGQLSGLLGDSGRVGMTGTAS